MKTIKFKKAIVKDICGIKNEEFAFDKDYSILTGMNGIGKSTFINAISYLLTKRSVDGNGKYDLMPILSDGSINKGAMCEVELDTEIDGAPFTFSMIREQKGKSYDFVYKINDDIMKGANEYYKQVMELFGFEDKDMFLSSFNIDYLISMGSKGRNIIMSLFDLDVEEVLKTSYKSVNGNTRTFTKRYKDFLIKNKNNNFEDMKKGIKTSADKLDDVLKQRQGALSEQEHNLKSVNTSDSKVNVADVDKQIAELENKRALLDANAQIIREENQEIDMKVSRRQHQEQKIKYSKEMLKEEQDKIENNKEKYREIKHRTNNECENCQARLKELEIETKEMIVTAKNIEEAIPKIEAQVVEMNKEINELENKMTKVIEGNDYDLGREIRELELSKKDDTKLVETIQARIKTLKNDIQDCNSKISLATAFALEHEAFVKAYSLRIEELVNDGLDGEFKIGLFKIQKNGNVKQTFEPMIGHIPFGMASTAEKARAKVNIVEILQAKLGVKIPLLVDFHESLDKKIKTNHQVIGVEVDRKQKTLSMKKEI